MSSYLPPASGPEQGHQERTGEALARELIELLGVEGARRMCREHSWDGLAITIDKVGADKVAA